MPKFISRRLGFGMRHYKAAQADGRLAHKLSQPKRLSRLAFALDFEVLGYTVELRPPTRATVANTETDISAFVMLPDEKADGQRIQACSAAASPYDPGIHLHQRKSRDWLSSCDSALPAQVAPVAVADPRTSYLDRFFHQRSHFNTMP